MKRRSFIRALTAAPAAPLLIAQQAPAPPAAAPPAAPPGQRARAVQGVQQFATASPDTVAAAAPSFFNAGQFAALRRLGSLLVPPRDGYPGAQETGAPEFLDFLIGVSPADSQHLYLNGLDALNAQANKQFGKSFAVLFAIGEGLCRDDVVNRCDAHHKAVTMNDERTRKQFFIRNRSPFEILQIVQYVKGSGVSCPGRVPGRLEHHAVNLYRQRFGFLVAHSCDSQSSM